MIADEINAMDVGLQIDVFSNSSLGPDADRVSSLIAGDIDLQGPSAISVTYEPIGVLDSAYAFTGADHLFEFFDSGAADQLQDGLLEATRLRTIQPYFFGLRNFSANSAIRTPEDLEGLRMRFPDTPAYLANAQAVGAEAVPLAFEELYLALQQGIVDGQESPIPTFKSLNLDEVQSHVDLSEHRTGVQLLVVNEDRWQSLSSERQDALNSVIATNRHVTALASMRRSRRSSTSGKRPARSRSSQMCGSRRVRGEGGSVLARPLHRGRAGVLRGHPLFGTGVERCVGS